MVHFMTQDKLTLFKVYMQTGIMRLSIKVVVNILKVEWKIQCTKMTLKHQIVLICDLLNFFSSNLVWPPRGRLAETDLQALKAFP